jgi:hypothetical protein
MDPNHQIRRERIGFPCPFLLLNIFLVNKSGSTAISCKKKQYWYITDRSTHHHTNRPQNNNKRTRHNTPPSSTKWERRSTELPTPALSSPTLCHDEAATRCRPEQPLSSSTMGLSASNCTYMLVDPSASVKLQQTLLSRF